MELGGSVGRERRVRVAFWTTRRSTARRREPACNLRPSSDSLSISPLLAAEAKGPFLDKSEFWLLDAVVELATSLSKVGSKNVAESFNRKSHGLSIPELTEVIGSLAQRELIVIFANRSLPKLPREHDLEVVTLTPAELTRQLTLPRRPPFDEHLGYLLTLRGGAAWEAEANPDWSRFIDGPWTDGDGNLEAFSGNRIRLERELHWPPDPFAFEHDSVAEESWEVLSPWRATYWKTLASGYHVKARVERERAAPTCAMVRKLQAAQRTHWAERKAFLSWYRNPYEPA